MHEPSTNTAESSLNSSTAQKCCLILYEMHDLEQGNKLLARGQVQSTGPQHLARD